VSRRADFVRSQLRARRHFFLFFFPMCALIALGAILSDASDGKPFGWQNLLIATGIAVGGGVVYFVSGLILQFVQATSGEDGRP
jgi:hypothetical protein